MDLQPSHNPSRVVVSLPLILLSLHHSQSPAAFNDFITQCLSLGFIFLGNLSVGSSKHLQILREWDFQGELGFVFLVAPSSPQPEEEKGPVKFLLCPVCSLPQAGLLFVLSLGIMRCFPISVNPALSMLWSLCNPGWLFWVSAAPNAVWLLSHFGINPKSFPF